MVKLVTSHFTLSPSLDTACPILGHSLATVNEREREKRHFPSAVKLEQLIIAECSMSVCVGVFNTSLREKVTMGGTFPSSPHLVFGVRVGSMINGLVRCNSNGTTRDC